MNVGLTKDLKNKPTPSYWEQILAQKFDVIIIGGGLVGMQIAIHHKLKVPNHQILVLDHLSWMRGASTRNAGFACFGSPGEILDDINNVG